LQLCAYLVTHHSQDLLISAGTGSGKTSLIILNHLLNDPRDNGMSLTISPSGHPGGNDFNAKYGIQTIVINDCTPREDTYWNM
ncbi:hypothetical protein L208DRAFT_1219457, partial [Tricholoma matsutake]